MAFSDNIYRLRKKEGLCEKEFASLFGASETDVRAWENDGEYPDRETIFCIAKHFNMTCDELLIQNPYADEDLPRGKAILPDFRPDDIADTYTDSLIYEYMQSIREGRDAEQYNKILLAIRKMPAGIHREKMADILFEALQNCRLRDDFRFIEPSDLENIKKYRQPYAFERNALSEDTLRDKIKGAWLGRICGCLLGKPIEGIGFADLEKLLKMTNNYPMNRYITAKELTAEMQQEHKLPVRRASLADKVSCKIKNPPNTEKQDSKLKINTAMVGL